MRAVGCHQSAKLPIFSKAGYYNAGKLQHAGSQDTNRATCYMACGMHAICHMHIACMPHASWMWSKYGAASYRMPLKHQCAHTVGLRNVPRELDRQTDHSTALCLPTNIVKNILISMDILLSLPYYNGTGSDVMKSGPTLQCGSGLHHSVDLRIQTYTEPVRSKYGKLATKCSVNVDILTV